MKLYYYRFLPILIIFIIFVAVWWAVNQDNGNEFSPQSDTTILTVGTPSSPSSIPGIEQASWSPVDDVIIVNSWLDRSSLYLFNPFEQKLDRLSFFSDNSNVSTFDMAWSPNGQEIAFWCNRDNMFVICIANQNGSNLQQISIRADSLGTSLNWSPDGNFILYDTTRAYGEDVEFYEIWTLAPDTGIIERQLGNQQRHFAFPSWSPDGTQIAFATSLENPPRFQLVTQTSVDQNEQLAHG